MGNLYTFQKDNDAPIIECTEVDGFSRPLNSELPPSVQRINSFRSELTAPIYQPNGPIRMLDGRGAGDSATPLDAHHNPHFYCYSIHRSHVLSKIFSLKKRNVITDWNSQRHSCGYYLYKFVLLKLDVVTVYEQPISFSGNTEKEKRMTCHRNTHSVKKMIKETR